MVSTAEGLEGLSVEEEDLQARHAEEVAIGGDELEGVGQRRGGNQRVDITDQARAVRRSQLPANVGASTLSGVVAGSAFPSR